MKRRTAKSTPPGAYEMYVEVTAAIDKYLRVYGRDQNVGFEIGFMLSTIADQITKQSGSDYFRLFLIRMLLDDEEQKR